jgi:hypothetical protein
MAERWIITPRGESPTVLPNTAVDGGVRVTEVRTPPPATRMQWSPRDRGALPVAREYENREITLKVQLNRTVDAFRDVTHDYGTLPTEAEGDGDLPGWTGTTRRAGEQGQPLLPALTDLASMIGALQAGGGTAERVFDSGQRITYDVHTAQDPEGPAWDLAYYAAQSTAVPIVLTCEPFGRGEEQLLGTAVKETGERFVTLDALQVPGDVAAVARLEFSGATVGQASLLFAVDQPDTATAATGTQIAATDLLGVPGVTETTESGAVHAAGVRVAAASAPSTPAGRWETVAYLRDAAGPPLALSGQFRVLARVRADQGETIPSATVRLRWSGGSRESGTSENTPATTTAYGWQLLDLGLVTVQDALDGIIERQTPAATPLRIDVLLLIPTDQSAVAVASTEIQTGVVLSADGMAGTGALAGSTSPTGDTWAVHGTGSSPSPFNRESDGSSRVGPATQQVDSVPVATTDVAISARFRLQILPQTSPVMGLCIGNPAGFAAIGTGQVAVDGAWAVAVVYGDASNSDFESPTFAAIVKVTGGQRAAVVTTEYSPAVGPYRNFAPMTLTLAGADARAEVAGLSLAGSIADMPADPAATRIGIYSYVETGNTMTVRDFVVAGTSAPDRLLHSDRTASIGTTHAERETPSGYVGLFIPEGNRPLLPHSGRAGRPTRVVMGTSREDLRTGTDAFPDDTFTASVYGTPLWLQTPDGTAPEVIDGGDPIDDTPAYPLDGGTP